MIYSDTDSVILPKALDTKYIGRDLGQLKLENEIKRGYFIGKKLYCYENINNEIIKASAGINSNQLTIQDFEQLLLGKDIIKYDTKFLVNHAEGGVTIDNNFKFTLKGINESTPIQMHINNPPIWLKKNDLYIIKNEK